MDAVDRGKVKLSDPVTLTRDDLTVFHQPIRDLILGSGSYTTTLNDLMVRQITESDNTANDKLMRVVGGPGAVRAMIKAKHLGAIRFYNGERALQSRIAGLMWSPSYSIGNAFFDARDALPAAIRKAAFDRYVRDPYDGAAPSAITTALARLKRGELLSPASTAFLLDVMHEAVAIGRAKGVALPENYAENRLAFCDSLPATMTSSMHHGLERGNRMELPWLSGGVADFGKALNIATPRNSAIADILELYAAGTH